MALLNFMRPKWKHGKEEIRLQAVRELPENDVDTLTSIVREDESQAVKSAALEKINNFDQLEELLHFDIEADTRQKIHHKINTLLKQQLLEAADDAVAEETLLRIDDQDILFEIATSSEDTNLRIKTVHRIDDQELLCRIMEQNCGKAPALVALNKINEQSLLERLSENASNRSIRRLASEKLETVTTALNPAQGEKDVQEQELKQFVKEAEDLTSTIDFDLAAGHLEELEQSWSRIDPETEHPLREAFEAAKNRFKDHQQNFLIEAEEEEIQGEDYAKKIATCETVCTTIEALVDSFSDNAIEEFKNAEALWNCDPAEKSDPIVFELADRFEKACKNFNETAKAADQEKQLISDISAGCGEVENLLVSKNIKSAKKRLLGLNERFQSLGCTYCDCSDTRKRLDDLDIKIQQEEQKQLEKNQQALEENISKRQAIIEKIEVLIQAENKSEADKQVKELRGEWDSLATLPSEEGKEEKERYQKALTEFSEIQDKFYHEMDWQRWANKNKKEELCNQAEELDNEEDLELLATTIKEIQALWKEVGPVPKKEADVLWERFKTACDRNYDRLIPYFEEKKKNRAENLQRKEEICKESEELANSEQWRETSDLLKAKQAEWKEIGFTSKNEDDALYKRFRTACDTFFNRRSEHYKAQDQQRSVHFEKKIKLCEAAENLAAEPIWQNGKKIRDLQAQWKGIGPAPRDKEQEVWKRFRAACDTFYSWLDGERQENLEKKEELCKQMEALTGGITDDTNQKEMAAQLSELQKTWKEIGPVPNEVKDEIWQRFNTPCEAFFNQRREQFQKLDEERQKNQTAKEAIIQQAEQILSDKDGKEAVKELQELQKKWKAIGPAPRKFEQELFTNFQSICNGFFQGRREQHEEFMASRLENLKKKEVICVQLENIIGTAPPEQEPAEDDQTLSLAERFKIAREANFMLAGNKNDKRRQKDEVIRLQQEWKKIGPVPREKDKQIWSRYNKSLDTFFNTKKEGNTGNKKTNTPDINKL